MRQLLALAATITAMTMPSATQPATTELTLVTREAPTLRSTSAQRDAVSITVYNPNFGLVREIRTLDLSSGRIGLEYGDGSLRTDRRVDIHADTRGRGER